MLYMPKILQVLRIRSHCVNKANQPRALVQDLLKSTRKPNNQR